VLSFYEEYDWFFMVAAVAGMQKRQAESQLRKASILSEEVLTRLYDIKMRLDYLDIRATELARDTQARLV
jgi:hypothetical protein